MTPEEEQARSVIQPEDNSPDVGMFVAMEAGFLMVPEARTTGFSAVPSRTA